MRDSGSGRVIAVVLAFVLVVTGAVVGLKLYHHFRPHLVGGATSPAVTLKADHDYNIALRYQVVGSPGVRIDAIHIPPVKGLDLTVTAVTCAAGVARQPLTEGPNLANSVFAPNLSPKAYFAQIVRKVYGYKIGTPRNPAMCAVLSVHSATAGTYHLRSFTLDWRAGLFVGSVHDQTDATLTFA
ncbi:MAG: hypothetical protein QOI76_3440 [Frankiales bacterium]|nr:hypothetical protein [Frankiales bacterium]